MSQVVPLPSTVGALALLKLTTPLEVRAGTMIVNHLSRELGARRLTVQEVANRAGLAYSTVHELYHARARRIDLETLDRLCRALDCTVGELLEYRPDSA